VVLIAHIPKSQRAAASAITASPGAMGIGGAARAGMMAAMDPDDESKTTRVLARTKGNLAPPWRSMAYRLLCSVCNEPQCEQKGHEHAVVEWTGESHHDGNSLLAARQTDDEKSALDEAKEWLESVLSTPRLKREVVKEARVEGITDMTLKRAAKAIPVVSERDDALQGRPATWSLPAGYGSRVMGQEGMTRNPQPSDQGKQGELEGYGSRTEHDPKPRIEGADDHARSLNPGLLGPLDPEETF
jgi:hypothetical protein